MKILRFGEPGKEKPGVLINNEIIDVSAFGEDFGEKFFETNGLERLNKWLRDNANCPTKGQLRSSIRCTIHQAFQNYLCWIKLHQACIGIEYAIAE